MINKKQFCTLVLFGIMVTAKVKAQLNVGIDAGMSYHKLQFKSDNDDLRLSKRAGYIVNINIAKNINKRLAVEVSPGLIQKNYVVKNKHNIYQNINNAYFHLPVSVKYDLDLLNKLKLSGALGVYYAYWAESSVSGVVPNVFKISNNSEGDELIQVERIKSNYKFDLKQDNRSEFGLAAGIGMNYAILKNVCFLIKGHYYQSITDQQKQKTEFQSQKYNQTYAMTIGFAYHFK